MGQSCFFCRQGEGGIRAAQNLRGRGGVSLPRHPPQRLEGNALPCDNGMIAHQILRNRLLFQKLRFYGAAQKHGPGSRFVERQIRKAKILKHGVVAVIVSADGNGKRRRLPLKNSLVSVADKTLLIPGKLPVGIIEDMGQSVVLKPPLALDFTQLSEGIPLILPAIVTDKHRLFLYHAAKAVYDSLAAVISTARMHIHHQFFFVHERSLLLVPEMIQKQIQAR